MQKQQALWKVEHLRNRFPSINFPEYQREPNLWARTEKQRLIDSMIRHFDIASIYLYEDEDGSLDCIDGRQRLGAIMSFLAENPDDPDNGFAFRRMNEIYEEAESPFGDVDGDIYSRIAERAEEGEAQAKDFLAAFRSYEFSVVSLSGSRRPEEFNLQFTRLNLGTIINSGEKLHAMVGAVRDVCFDVLGKHAFLQSIGIPTRRYAQQQVAAQILAQIFSIESSGKFTRTRHFDLQRFFKEHATLDPNQRELIGRVLELMDILNASFESPAVLKNRALTVSTVLMSWTLEIADRGRASELASFLEEFLCRLKWQLGKGLDMDVPYRPLMDFQRHVTQASVEKAAVEKRHAFLMAEYEHWIKHRQIRGDAEYPGDAATECRQAK